MKMTIIDYGLSNLLSVQHAFAHFGAETLLTSKPEDVLAADALVLPANATGFAAQSLPEQVEASATEVDDLGQDLFESGCGVHGFLLVVGPVGPG